MSGGSGSYHGGSGHGFSWPGNWPTGNGRGGPLDLNGFTRNGNGMSRTDVNGNHPNPNSLSRVNSSSVNDLSSVGMSPNAADSSSESAGSGASGGEDSFNAYELKEVKKEIDPDDNWISIIFILVALMLIIIGYYRESESED